RPPPGKPGPGRCQTAAASSFPTIGSWPCAYPLPGGRNVAGLSHVRQGCQETTGRGQEVACLGRTRTLVQIQPSRLIHNIKSRQWLRKRLLTGFELFSERANW